MCCCSTTETDTYSMTVTLLSSRLLSHFLRRQSPLFKAERNDCIGYKSHPSYATVCSCMSNCTVPKYTSSNRPRGCIVLEDSTERSHSSNKQDFGGQKCFVIGRNVKFQLFQLVSGMIQVHDST